MKSIIERTYSLGQYQNIKIQSEVEIDDNYEVIRSAEKNLQLVELEITYMNYVKMLKEIENFDFEDRYKFLVDLKQKIEKDMYDEGDE